MKPLRIFIVDDEPNAVNGLQTFLERQARLNVVGTSLSAEDAIRDIKKLKPDVVMLDIEMPGKSGFDVISEIGIQNMPYVIFVTAYEEFALQAFDVHAFAYVLKPVDQSKLLRVISRVRKQVLSDDIIGSQNKLLALMNTLAAGDSTHVRGEDRLAIKSRGSIVLVPTKDILWVESSGNYVRYNVENSWYLSRATLNEIEQRLDPAQFQRIHRSSIVNLARVTKLTPDSNGELSIELDSGRELTVSKRYRNQLKGRFEPT